MERIDGVIDPHLHIFVCAESLEKLTPFKIEKLVHSIQQKAHLYAPLCRRIESRHHGAAALVRPEIKGGKDQRFLCRLDHSQTKNQGLLVVIDAGDALLIFQSRRIFRSVFQGCVSRLRAAVCLHRLLDLPDRLLGRRLFFLRKLHRPQRPQHIHADDHQNDKQNHL